MHSGAGSHGFGMPTGCTGLSSFIPPVLEKRAKSMLTSLVVDPEEDRAVLLEPAALERLGERVGDNVDRFDSVA